jgi:hypothetical protein
MNIIFLSCTAAKTEYKCRAEELYSPSPMFQKSLEYSKRLKSDRIYVLSALHYVVPLDKELEPYNKTVKDMSKNEKDSWGLNVKKILEQEGINLKEDRFIFFAGQEYQKPLTKFIPPKNLKDTLIGKRFGERLKWFNEKLNK